MRVFVGVKAPKALQKEITNWQDANKNLPVRFIKPENLHLTLIPPWYENNINHLVKYLEKFDTGINLFTITFDKIITAPSSHPRLIWAEGQTPTEFPKLNKELSNFLKRPREKRPLKTHITIARFRPYEFRKIGRIEQKINFGTLEVSEITIFESKLSPRGANYKIIETFKLNLLS